MAKSMSKTENKRLLRDVTGKRGGPADDNTRYNFGNASTTVSWTWRDSSQVSHPWTVQWRTVQLIFLKE